MKEWRHLWLLDTPQRAWPGRGKASASGYTQRQLELWLALLDQRFHKQVPIGALYNVPVFGWLYRAAKSGVSLQQVQRAMTTWLNVSNVPRSYRVARQTATLFVRNHASPRAKGRRRDVVDQLADMIYQGGYPPEADLRELFGLVMDPDRRGEVRGPAQAPLSAESTSVMIHARRTAGEQIQSIPDALWEWARVSYHWVMQHYQALYPEFAADPQTGHLFERPDLEMVANKACFLLLTHLGTGLLVVQEKWRPDGLPPELLQPSGSRAR